jgi:hypothetical protein
MAASQHALITLEQFGLTHRAVQKRAADGRLHRIYAGVYSIVPPALLPYRGRLLAAVLACGDGAALSHRSAADLLGLRRCARVEIDVVVPRDSTHSHPEIQVHRSRTLTTNDVSLVDAVPCTTVARTQLDLSAVVSTAVVERALNQAEALRVLDVRELEGQLARNPRHPGAASLRAAMENLSLQSAVTESVLEERLLELVAAAGLPRPHCQVWLPLPDGGDPIRADFVWPAARLILETDGRTHHGTRRAFEADRRRDQRLLLAGWRVVRVTWRQLTQEPESVVKLLDELLRAP